MLSDGHRTNDQPHNVSRRRGGGIKNKNRNTNVMLTPMEDTLQFASFAFRFIIRCFLAQQTNNDEKILTDSIAYWYSQL